MILTLLLALAVLPPPDAPAPPPIPASVPHYTLTDLGPITDSATEIMPAINDADVVSAWAMDPSQPHACLWRAGTRADLDPLTDFPQTFAADVNASGDAVGFGRALIDRRFTRAIFWKDGKANDLGTIGGKYASAFAINDADQIAGAAETADRSLHAVCWKWVQGKAVAQDIGTLGTGTFSEAHAINHAGHMAGASEMVSGGSKRAFFWDGTTMKDIGALPGGSLSSAHAMNNEDAVVGWSDTGDSDLHAFLWKQGKMIDLGTLGEDPISALGINDREQIVGTSSVDSNTIHAFFWQDGTMYDLNRLMTPVPGWVLQKAFAINQRGSIVGVGKFKGRARLFLLTPAAP